MQWLAVVAVFFIAAFILTSRVDKTNTSLLSGLQTAAVIGPDGKEVELLTGGRVAISENQILIKFKENTSVSRRQDIYRVHGLQETGEIPGIGVKVLTIGSDEHTPDEVVARIMARERGKIEFAEVDAIIAPGLVPNDPSYPIQWGLPKISAPQGWDVTTGDVSVIVGIADTGVDCNHPDLAAKCVQGWNFYNNNSDTTDVYGHGTKVAGVATAITNNTAGVAGVCWNCKIMPLRISGTDGYASYSAGASAITYAADRGVRVVNISYQMSESSTVRNAAQYMTNKGGVVTISAGNQGTVITTSDNPYVLTVSGTDSNDNKYSWSNSGKIIDIAAPGCTYTTLRGGGYGSACGTSFSAPMTAGLAAVLISKNPSLTGNQTQDAVKQGSDDKGATGWDAEYGWGRINLAGSLALVGGSTPPPTTGDTTAPSTPTNLSATAPDHTKVNLSWSTSTDNVGVAGYQITRDGVVIGASLTTSYGDTSIAGGQSYTYTVKAHDAAGNYSAASNPMSITVPVEQIALSITSYQVSGKTSSSATIQWNTNLSSVGVIRYGTSKNNLNMTYTDNASGTSHTATLTGLQPFTTYHYEIAAYRDGQATTVTSNFKTAKDYTGGGGKPNR